MCASAVVNVCSFSQRIYADRMLGKETGDVGMKDEEEDAEVKSKVEKDRQLEFHTHCSCSASAQGNKEGTGGVVGQGGNLSEAVKKLIAATHTVKLSE